MSSVILYITVAERSVKTLQKAQLRNEFLLTVEEDGDVRSDDVNRYLSLIWK